MQLAELAVAEGTGALLFDLDGVLIDSLSQDLALVGPLLAPYAGTEPTVAAEVVRRWFPLALDDFWAKVAADLGITLPVGALPQIIERHERLRRESAPIVHDGIVDILTAGRTAGLPIAVVSNNPRAEVEQILAAGDLLDLVDAVVGNDGPALARKPAPDPYLLGARLVGVPAPDCVAIEDSVLGLESAHRAGCYSVAVATGAATLAELASCGYADRVYSSFRAGASGRERAAGS